MIPKDARLVSAGVEFKKVVAESTPAIRQHFNVLPY